MDNVTGLHPAYGGSGAVHLDGGRLENCTVVGNRITTSSIADWKVAGAGYVCVKGGVTNTIAWGNVFVTNNVEVVDNVSVGSIPFVAYSCAPELTPGERGNISDDPLFVDPSGGNYRLGDGSPCINTGSNLDWMDGAFDLDGLSRVNARRVDMGAYEYIAPPGTAILIR